MTFTSVSTEGAFACGLTSSGQAYCWGFNEGGQVGNGTVVDRRDGGVSVPAAVDGGHSFVSITTAAGHACGLTAGGQAYCWGRNSWGNLGTSAAFETCVTFVITGDDEYPCSTRPVPVEGGLSFASISAGGITTCGLTGTGAAYCWGANRFGEVGSGSMSQDSYAAPQPVAGGLTFASLSTGNNVTCGLTTSGVAYCWGRNEFGSLGIGTFDSQAHPVPEPVSGGLTFASLSTGNEYACGLTAAGDAHCWGVNSFWGHLGTGSDLDAPSPQSVTGGIAFTALSSLLNHTCGLATDGRAYCWGANDIGQLGVGSVDDLPHRQPVLVFGQG